MKYFLMICGLLLTANAASIKTPEWVGVYARPQACNLYDLAQNESGSQNRNRSGGTSYQYCDEENGGIRPEMKIPVGSTSAHMDFSVVTNYAAPLIESDYPTIRADYASKSEAADKLKKLEVRLFVGGAEITADETSYEASHFSETVAFAEPECCEKLGEKLKIGEQKSNVASSFSVSIVKKYKSLKRLPPQLTVLISATTDEGTFEMTKTLNLKAYKSSFIRFH